MLRKNSTYQGFETAWTSARMAIKMHLYIILTVLILHALASVGWTFWQNWEHIIMFKDYVWGSLGLLSGPDKAYVSEFLDALKRLCLDTAARFLPIWILYPVILGLFKRRAESQGGKHQIRGAELLSEKELIAAIKKERGHRGSRLKIGAVPIPRQEEVKHWFVVGRPGVGKTVAISSVIEQFCSSDGRGIIYDFKGDFTARFFRPGKDLIFNPLDERGLDWNILSEARTPMDIEGISASLIPEGEGDGRFWNSGARNIFSGVLNYCYNNHKRTNRDIWETVSLPMNELVEILRHTRSGAKGYSILQNKDKTAACFLTNLSIYTCGLEYMADSCGDFSIRDWLDDDCPGFIYVTNFSKVRDALKPVLSLFIDLMSRELLAKKDDYNRRVFFLLDEFGTLQSLNSIRQLLTLSRSKGGSIWIGIQDIGQIEATYGREGRQSIINSCGGNLIFSVADPDTSEYLSRKIGDHEYYEVEASHSMGPGDRRDGLSLAQRKQAGRLVLPSQLQNLKDLNCYLKVPGFDVAKIKLDFKQYSDRNGSFILREGLDLETIVAKQRQIEQAIDALYQFRAKGFDSE